MRQDGHDFNLSISFWSIHLGGGPEHVAKGAPWACFDRVSGAQLNVDTMNARGEPGSGGEGNNSPVRTCADR